MTADADFSNLVGQLYDCIVDPQLWPDTLGRITRNFHGELATVAMLDVARNEAYFPAVWGPTEMVNPLVTTYHRSMPFYALTELLELDQPHSILDFFSLAGPDGVAQFLASDMGRNWVVPNNLFDGIAVLVDKREGHVGALVINRHKDVPPVNAEDCRRMSLIAPHLRRAVTIGDLFGQHSRATALFGDIVDQLAHAVIVVTADMTLTYANSAAEALLQAGVLVRVASGRVVFTTEQAASTIRQAIRTGEQAEMALGALGIGVPTYARDVAPIAHILPLARRDLRGQFHSRASAAIFINLGTGPRAAAVDSMAAFFGLSPSERRVAALLNKGLNRSQIARACGLSEHTIKSQLDAVFAKSGTHGQKALIDLIRQFASPLNRGHS